MTKARILDPSFVYVPSGSTDIRKTFARIRREQRRQSEAETHRVTAPVPMLPFRKATPK
jgi:hypothetical protein